MHSYQLSQWILFFFLYSFVGWVWESCFVSVRKHRWVNRGFLHGPILPIYGTGALTVLISTIRVRDEIWMVFLVGMLAATVLEYLTGAVMEQLFHVRYWDYSHQRLNVNGYICVSSSLCWGCFSVLLVDVVHVPVERAVLDLPVIVAEGLALVMTAAASVDVTQSFNEAMDLKRILVQLEESREQIRKIQEKLKLTSEERLADYRRHSAELREEYRRFADEASERNRSRKAAYLERIHMRRIQRRLQLEELAARVEFLMKDELPAKVDELIGAERREELADLKKTIVKEVHRMTARTDRSYLRIAGQLKRNPTAASKRFADVLEELRSLLDPKEAAEDGNDDQSAVKTDRDRKETDK